MSYDFKKIEPKWQKFWEKSKTFKVEDKVAGKENYYCLVMFPYPSGHLHMGHVRNYVIGDVVARYKRMQGYNVLHPIGWDAFGLPAENAAIKHGVHPKKWTLDNINYMRKQIQSLGISYDWSREIVTASPEYYRWNQWLFIKFYERGLVYRKKALVNWCPGCKTVLANEQVSSENRCWRCSSLVEYRELEQWFFAIRKYAERLLSDMKFLRENGNWPERVLLMQENWIGRSEGANVLFSVVDGRGEKKYDLQIFTTRPDTLFGVTFMALSVTHELSRIISCSNPSVREFIDKEMKNIQRKRGEDIEKEGIFTGYYAINPVNDEKVPVYVTNYVLPEYGTGAIMAVPAHDKRDFEFARKYNIRIKEVIKPFNEKEAALPDDAYEGEGVMVDSGKFSGLPSQEGKKEIVKWLEGLGKGKAAVEYKIRDWLISRQRYWGTPIPIIYCDNCGTLPVPEEQLPVLLPEDVKITGTGVSPLAMVEEFVNTRCPKCNGKARRETDTMDTFVDSSWYYLRYCDPNNDKMPFDKEISDLWTPVDIYIGGIEHACMHLIYARFFHKVLYDLGLVESVEPFKKLVTQGMVTLGGVAMSKSRGNIVEPEEVIEKYGVDTLRLFILFAAPPEKDLEWSSGGVEGLWRFTNRVYRLIEQVVENRRRGQQFIDAPDARKKLLNILHRTIKRVKEDIEKRLQFNTAIASLMELVNFLYQYKNLGDEYSTDAVNKLLLLLAPFAPHLANEGYLMLNNKEGIDNERFPTYDEKFIIEEKVKIPVQINGKLRDVIEIDSLYVEDSEYVKQRIYESEKIKKYIEGKEIKNMIYVPGKIVNVVT
jgi:leucyl-tRNA synthetase